MCFPLFIVLLPGLHYPVGVRCLASDICFSLYIFVGLFGIQRQFDKLVFFDCDYHWADELFIVALVELVLSLVLDRSIY